MGKISQRVLDESPYQRACAIWVARMVNVNPDIVWGVDFYLQDGYQECNRCDPDSYGSFDTGPSFGLEYQKGGSYETLDLTYIITPARFLEECVQILAEIKEIP